MLIGLQFQVTLQQNQKLQEVRYGVIFILFMYKIFKYCLSKARLRVLKVLLCVYRVFGFFRCCLAFLRVDLAFSAYDYLVTLVWNHLVQRGAVLQAVGM